MASTYTGPAGSQVRERIIIGLQQWDRVGGGGWTAGPIQVSVWHQLSTLLPNAAQAHDPQVVATAEGAVLRWVEPSDGAEVTLQVDPATGTPRSLERRTRSTGAVFRVTFVGWNVPVEISPPQPG
jgi:hypothetical protein